MFAQHFLGGTKRDLSEKAVEFRLYPMQVYIVAKAMVPGHGGARLVGVQFPGVKIKHDRLSFVSIHALNAASEPIRWEEPEVAATTDGQVRAKEPGRANRELD